MAAGQVESADPEGPAWGEAWQGQQSKTVLDRRVLGWYGTARGCLGNLVQTVTFWCSAQVVPTLEKSLISLGKTRNLSLLGVCMSPPELSGKLRGGSDGPSGVSGRLRCSSEGAFWSSRRLIWDQLLSIFCFPEGVIAEKMVTIDVPTQLTFP